MKIVSCSVKATQLHQALGYRADKFINIPNGYALEKLKQMRRRVMQYVKSWRLLAMP